MIYSIIPWPQRSISCFTVFKVEFFQLKFLKVKFLKDQFLKVINLSFLNSSFVNKLQQDHHSLMLIIFKTNHMKEKLEKDFARLEKHQ